MLPGRSKTRYRWNNDIPIRLNKNVSIAIPDTDGLLILCHCSRVTVHGGNHRARFPAFTTMGVLCALHMWSTQSCDVPFQTVPEGTGQRHKLRQIEMIQSNVFAEVYLNVLVTRRAMDQMPSVRSDPACFPHLFQLTLITSHKRKQVFRPI